ncbi:hypothetical protein MSEN_36250 [Mycolicibacter senuensis]|uniref:Uncharacterized protein n=1 Tax=Mycolicibacter senuensis TaxID=386913 RepID=A0A7I9XPK0_9MYCO|nr:hypothetical protein MSEN_36250 [Mycolicibacter senuensis]
MAAPAAHADFDDLLDPLLGAGADPDWGGLPPDSADIGDLGVLQDPLSQLDQLFHDSSSPADGPAESAPGAPTNDPSDSTEGDEHSSASGGSNNLPSLPKFGMPGSGSGGSGGGPGGGSGGGPGGSGGSNPGAAKTKANTSSAGGAAVVPPAPQP